MGGALFGTLPAVMKNRFGASELITTIMFNYVALYFVHYMIAGPIKDLDSGSNFAQSKQMLESAQLPRLLAGTRLHAGLIVAAAALVFYQFFLFHTTRGYEMRVIGLNRTTGECAGMNPRTNTLLSMFLAGGFAGLGGACELMGVQLRIMENAFNGFGFDGVAVALAGGQRRRRHCAVQPAVWRAEERRYQNADAERRSHRHHLYAAGAHYPLCGGQAVV